MNVFERRPMVLLLLVILLGTGALWTTSSLAAKTQTSTLPQQGTILDCLLSCLPKVSIQGVGTFQMDSTDGARILAEAGEPFISAQGQTTVPLRLASFGGTAFAEGLGGTHFWLDTSRPVPSAVWEKVPGTGSPVVLEMRFHFFYALDAMPGKTFRSVLPAVMRADDLPSFPPPPGSVCLLVSPVPFEDVAQPGVVLGSVESNRAVFLPSSPASTTSSGAGSPQ
jgi:hypothetical protein